MSSLKQNIRSVLADVETFLVETLKSVKLNSSAKDHKDRLLEKIRQVLDDIPGSAGSFADSNASGGSLKISGGGDSGSGGTSSSNLQTLGDEDPNYSSNITKVAVADLKNKLQSGMLEKKKKSGFKSWEPFYCVVNGNIFYLYKKQGDSKQKEAFCLNGYEFQEAPGIEKDASRKETCFELVQAGEPTYQFRAGSKDGMLIWREAITKGIQIAAEEAPGEMYEDVGQENDSSGNIPAPAHPEEFEDPDDIYEECGEELSAKVASQPPLPAFKPPPPQPQAPEEPPDDVYDACASALEEEKKSEPPAPPRREPPPIPPTSELPPLPPPKADLPAIPKSVPPPVPDRRPGAADVPPLPNTRPPLPTRGESDEPARIPQLRKPFMDRDEDFENLYYGKWDCAADSAKELAFKQGDIIHVLSRDFEAQSWWVGELEGKVGLVPKEYLCPAFELVP